MRTVLATNHLLTHVDCLLRCCRYPASKQFDEHVSLFAIVVQTANKQTLKQATTQTSKQAKNQFQFEHIYSSLSPLFLVLFSLNIQSSCAPSNIIPKYTLTLFSSLFLFEVLYSSYRLKIQTALYIHCIDTPIVLASFVITGLRA